MSKYDNPERVSFSDRGFAQYDTIETDNGMLVRVYESSSARSPHIWLSITDAEDDTLHPGAKSHAAHLTIEQIDYLIEGLVDIRNNHYQFDD